MLYLNTNYNHHHYRIVGRTTKHKGRTQKKKKVKRMTSCKKEGGGWVKIILSNFLKRMTNFKEGYSIQKH